jgi:calcineurin-like phosphoesterase
MRMDHLCPFEAVDRVLESIDKNDFSAIIVDVHAETTSEKVALSRYLDGRVSAIIGTHTHIQTNDCRISDMGTGYMTDAGMVGYSEGVLGLDGFGIIETYLTQIKKKHVMPETGKFSADGVFLEIEPKKMQCLRIEPVKKRGSI